LKWVLASRIGSSIIGALERMVFIVPVRREPFTFIR